MPNLADYLVELRATRATGANTPETSFYPALKALFDAIGAGLKPKVLCVMNLRDQGAGLPDGGLFTADQFGRKLHAEAVAGALGAMRPSRGAIEVKPPAHDLGVLAGSAQVSRYGAAYRHVLITNLREFALVEQTTAGVVVLERFALAASEAELWAKAARPQATADELGPRFEDFLRRVLLTPAPLASPEDLAWFLASYARDALAQIEHAKVPGLTDIAANLEAVLGVGFGGDKGRHFFHSTLVQTLFYGVFSAWVLWCRGNPPPGARFAWRDTGDLLHLTMLRVLFHEMTRPTTFFSHFLRDSLDLAEAALNRVERAEFFQRFREHEAVQYFYEPFLEAFDPALRKELGVWYTPDEVVRYMVERCDRSLREDLGIAAGFADPSVQVLDPCCGTGAFLVAVLDRIRRTLEEQGEGALAQAQVAQAVRERIIGFEIMPAPYVVAHLQVALYLHGLGARLGDDQRAAIWLTNALTGWEKPIGRQQRLLPELADERAAADQVKRQARVIVVLGNPPYNAFSGVQPAEEQESVEVYKQGLYEDWGIRKYNLDDLYVRFLRLAERKIAEQSRRGIVCLISNASYAADPSFVVLRQRFLRAFDRIVIDNLNGDSRETGKKTPEGKPDPSVFSTERNREGIKVGTAIGLFVLGAGPGTAADPAARKKAGGSPAVPGMASVAWRDFWGAAKRAELLASVDGGGPAYQAVAVSRDGKWSFKPQAGSAAYGSWPRVTELCGREPISGLMEKRRMSLIGIIREDLEARMRSYFDSACAWEDAVARIAGLAENFAGFDAKGARAKALSAESFSEKNIRRFSFMPFDNRWCYHTGYRPIWNSPRPELAAQVWDGNGEIVVRMAARQADEGYPVSFSRALVDAHLLDPSAMAIPLRWRTVELGTERITANLAPLARSYLTAVGIADPDADEPSATALWHYALAVAYSPAWLAENSPAIRADFPRVPLPADRAVLDRGAALGRRLADLLDPDRPVDGVTTGTVRPEWRRLGQLQRRDGAAIDAAAGDLRVAARWGAFQRGSVVMPGPGRVTAGAAGLDVWLNDRVRLAEVPEAVWAFTIGGYQVIKKWLSYREHAVLGRDLGLDEARHLTGMVRRLAAVLAMAHDLDGVYNDAKARTWVREDA